MKFLLSILLFVSLNSYSQVASRLLSTQASSVDGTGVANMLFVDTTAIGMFRILPRKLSKLEIKPYNMYWLQDTIVARLNPYIKKTVVLDSLNNIRVGLNTKLKSSDTTSKWKPIAYHPTWSEVTSKPTFFNGDYNSLTNTPNLSLYYLNSNPNNYFSSARNLTINGTTQNLTSDRNWNVGTLVANDTISLSNRVNLKLTKSDTTNKWLNKVLFTSAQINNLYGYTPYNGTINPLGFLTSINSGNVTSALGFTPYNSTNPNGYISSFTELDPLFNTKFSAKSTTDLIEGSRLYYTDSRSRTSISGSTGISYNNTTGVITNSLPDQTVVLNSGTGVSVTGTYPTFTITNSVSIPVDYTPTRPVNSTTYTISSTKVATVRYNIKISCTATIGSLSTGKVLFQYSINGGTTWIDAGEVENSNQVTLAVVLNSTTTQSGFITWNVPANALCRLVSSSTGTTTITWIRGQETY